MNFRTLLAATTVAALVTGAVATQASAATITDLSGAFTVGIGANGELFDGGPYIGFRRNVDGFDPISPGTPRDSWGLNGSYADGQDYGSNLVSTSIVAGANSATATSLTSDNFQVVQDYSFFGPNVLVISTSVTNLDASAQSALFQRNVDWDPTTYTFYNNTFGPIGAYGPVVDASYFGFEHPAPSNGPFNNSCFVSCNEDGDLGAGIRLDLGTLASGATTSFKFYYGLSQYGQSVDDVIGQTQAAGAKYLIAGQSDENGLYPFLGGGGMTLGVSSGAVPEPASWAMMLTGFAGIGAVIRRRRKVLVPA